MGTCVSRMLASSTRTGTVARAMRTSRWSPATIAAPTPAAAAKSGFTCYVVVGGMVGGRGGGGRRTAHPRIMEELIR